MVIVGWENVEARTARSYNKAGHINSGGGTIAARSFDRPAATCVIR